MKRFLIATALVAMAGAMPLGAANAAGCLKGAAVGGVAGHFVGHGHGLLGAGIGCLVGRHHANKAARERSMQDQNYTTMSTQYR
jgi:uncharacterized protein YcfJ